MSFTRENVAWQSPDGTWNLGFYRVAWTGDDPEWDVEYDNSSFEWVSTGHRTEHAATDAWDGANPGGSTIYDYNVTNAADCDTFDEMAKTLEARSSLNKIARLNRVTY